MSSCAGCTLSSLHNDIRAEFPHYRIVYKELSPLMRMVGLLLFLLTAGAQRSFMSDYVTTIGTTVYVPFKWDAWTDDIKIGVLLHERVHMRQAKKYTFPLYAFLYLFVPLPLGLAYFRMRFEREAYEETIRYDLETRPKLLDPERLALFRRVIIDQFTTGAYGWMWPFRHQLECWFDDVVLQHRINVSRENASLSSRA